MLCQNLLLMTRNNKSKKCPNLPSGHVKSISLVGGGGGLKNCHFAIINEPFVTLFRGRGYEISIFHSDILFAWPQGN